MVKFTYIDPRTVAAVTGKGKGRKKGNITIALVQKTAYLVFHAIFYISHVIFILVDKAYGDAQ